MITLFHIFPTAFYMTWGQQCKLFYHKLFFSAENNILPTEVRKEALQLQNLLEYDDGGAEGECCCFFLP